ncbi:MAG TPA: phospholipid carrier-dependent glycosyltransferase [Candidatus Solibacter sp.]|nr:phospholipid carrier-dependent glycosyltransferase [Candidatus Solibacter sp.]
MAGFVEVRTALGETQTWDEGIHIWSGYAYLTRGDFSWNTEHPPLVKMMCALPLLSMGLTPPHRADHDQVDNAKDFLYSNRRHADDILFAARSVNIVLTVLFIGAIAWWTRRRWGWIAGIWAAALCAFDPNLIAHGRYVTTDYPLTVFFFFACVLWTEYLESGGRERLLVASLAIAIAMVVKFSAVLVLPPLALLYIVCWIRRPSEFPLRRAFTAAATVTVVLTVTAAIVYWPETVRCFRTNVAPLAKAVAPDNFIGSTMVWLGERLHLPAHTYLVGLARVAQHNTGGHHSYLLGMRSDTGFWHYFPVAFAVKSTLAAWAALLLVIAGGAAMVARRGVRAITPMALGLALPPLIYFVFSMTSAINLGQRHILPIYPFLYVGAVAMVATLDGRLLLRRAAMAALFLVTLVQAAECASIYPDYLAFFNAAVGGPDRGPEYLVDSNIDWGQDVKKLLHWLDQHGTRRARVHYFGSVRLPYYGIEEVGFPDPLDKRGWDEVDDYVVANVTNLMGVYTPLNSLAPVRGRKPIAKIGWSMYVYDLRKHHR